MPKIDIAELRRTLGGISQAELGRRLGGVNQATISRWETGDCEPPPTALMLMNEMVRSNEPVSHVHVQSGTAP